MCFQPFPHGKERAEPAPFISMHLSRVGTWPSPHSLRDDLERKGYGLKGPAQPFEAREAGSLGPSRTGLNRHANLAGQLSCRQGTQGEDNSRRVPGLPSPAPNPLLTNTCQLCLKCLIPSKKKEVEESVCQQNRQSARRLWERGVWPKTSEEACR